jgi:hypothetical protein
VLLIGRASSIGVEIAFAELVDVELRTLAVIFPASDFSTASRPRPSLQKVDVSFPV